MPYAVRKRDTKYAVVNTETGKVKGTHTTKEKAQRQINLLRGVEHGWTPSRSRRQK